MVKCDSTLGPYRCVKPKDHKGCHASGYSGQDAGRYQLKTWDDEGNHSWFRRAKEILKGAYKPPVLQKGCA